jgi:hypothetical protein
MFVRTDDFPGGMRRTAEIDRTGGMVLYPLTEVGVGMLMSIRIGGSELMVDVLSHGKGSQ